MGRFAQGDEGGGKLRAGVPPSHTDTHTHPMRWVGGWIADPTRHLSKTAPVCMCVCVTQCRLLHLHPRSALAICRVGWSVDALFAYMSRCSLLCVRLCVCCNTTPVDDACPASSTLSGRGSEGVWAAVVVGELISRATHTTHAPLAAVMARYSASMASTSSFAAPAQRCKPLGSRSRAA